MSRSAFFDAAVSMGLIDSWMPPFLGISPASAPSRGALRRKFSHFMESGLPLTVQLLGHDADALAETAYRLYHGLGICSVNLNFACPSRTVLRSGSGGALLRNPGETGRIAAFVRKRVPEVCLSVKLRAGFDIPDEGLVKKFCDAGVNWIIFHFRTVKENYSGVERSEAIRRIASAVKAAGSVPVFGNGDILTAQDAMFMREQTGCSGIAAGRGFFRNPFLLKEICGGLAEEDLRSVFLERLSADAGDRKACWLECVKLSYGADSKEFLNAFSR